VSWLNEYSQVETMLTMMAYDCLRNLLIKATNDYAYSTALQTMTHNGTVPEGEWQERQLFS